MSSVSRSTAQPIPYFYAAPGTVQHGEINIFTESTSVPGTGSFTPTSNTSALSTCVAAGGLLKDMGRTVVSAGRTFRKVAFLSAGMITTEGVIGLDTTYEAFYVELGIPAFGMSANVVPSGIVRYY
jgi:hypothetical protein